MLGGRELKQLYEMHGRGASIREIAVKLGVSRSTVRKYLRAAEIPRAKPRDSRATLRRKESAPA